MQKFAYCLLGIFILFASPFLPASPAQSVGVGSVEIGRSVQDRPIEYYRLGTGEKAIVLYGGIHGGYEWNTVLLARELIDYFSATPTEIPDDVSLYVIPVLNPDGLARIFGKSDVYDLDFDSFEPAATDTRPGRFNARGVDLNRNWDARRQPTSQWQNRTVDAGSAPFSEPETQVLRDFVRDIGPKLVISYHSAANGIYYGGKQDRWEPARLPAEAYSRASGYPIPDVGTGLVGYRITGASGGYFYSQSVPEITVELARRRDPEFSQNMRGIQAVMEMISDLN